MRGDVTVRAECLMPEKLIERAIAKGARFEEIRRPDDKTLIVSCDERSTRRLLALCRRYGLSASVTDRRGGSALRRFVRRRLTLLLGIALAIALSALFLGRIWKIDIVFTGENAVLGDSAAVKRSLEGLGICPGISRHIDTALVAQTIQAEAGSYSYVGAHLQGVRLLVEAVPETPAPQVYDVDAARDLVSAVDGIVVRAVARSGILCVEPGDAICRGQLLIRGEERSGPEDETRPVAALGEVIVRTWFEGSATLPRSAERWEDTGRTSTGVMLAGPGFEWPIAEAEGFESQREEIEYLPIGGLFVPLEIQRVTRYETRTIAVDLDPDAAKERLSALALADAALNLARSGTENDEPAESWTDYDIRDGALHARAVLEIHTDAAVTRETLQGG